MPLEQLQPVWSPVCRSLPHGVEVPIRCFRNSLVDPAGSGAMGRTLIRRHCPPHGPHARRGRRLPCQADHGPVLDRKVEAGFFAAGSSPLFRIERPGSPSAQPDEFFKRQIVTGPAAQLMCRKASNAAQPPARGGGRIQTDRGVFGPLLGADAVSIKETDKETEGARCRYGMDFVACEFHLKSSKYR